MVKQRAKQCWCFSFFFRFWSDRRFYAFSFFGRFALDQGVATMPVLHSINSSYLHAIKLIVLLPLPFFYSALYFLGLIVFIIALTVGKDTTTSTTDCHQRFLYILRLCSWGGVTGRLVYWFKTLLLVWEVLGSISRAVKSGSVSPTVRHRRDVSLELCCPGAIRRGDGP